MANRIIHINQEGYRSEGIKRAAVINVEDIFSVVEDATGKVIYQGEVKKGVDSDPSSGDHVRWLDFSAVNAAGRYRLELLPDLFRSLPFTIKDRPYQALKNGLLKGLYYQRCGCALEEEHAGPWTHKPCHTTPAVLYENPEVQLDITGGWHDAGDYGKYVVPGAVSAAMMLLAYEHVPEVFTDKIGIPESSNDVPDLLNEARWELEWLLKMQTAEGGAYHKATTAKFPGAVMPEDDLAEWIVTPISTTATATLTAVAAMASRFYAPYDQIFAERLLSAARLGWKWLEAHPEEKGFQNPEGIVTGEYGDPDNRDERLWAAAALYRTTLENTYAAKMVEMLHKWNDIDTVSFGWSDVGGFAATEILFMQNADEQLNALLRTPFLKEAERLKAIAANDGYGIPLLPKDYIWGSTMVLGNRGVHLLLASKLAEEKELESIAEDCLHWLMGRNPMGTCYVTGFGIHSVKHPHHRPSEADSVEDPVPGFVSGGPNAGRNDSIAQRILSPELPPARAFVDDSGSYATNEVAIYWNTPALFLAAWFDR